MKVNPVLMKDASWERLFLYWNGFFINFFKPYYKQRFFPDLFISREILEKSKYLSHFPHNLFSVDGSLKSAKLFISPAACLHFYPTLEGQKIGNKAAFGIAHCARKEKVNTNDMYRLTDFHMAELVIIGSKKYIIERKEEVKEKVGKVFADLNFKGNFQYATDAFFLGQGSGEKIMQKLKRLKEEYLVENKRKQIAVASVNYHEDYFGRNFNIKTSGQLSHSFCAAFGMERLTTFSLKLWGQDESSWPREFKKYAEIL